MNWANAFNEDGQRILPERLYSPLIRLFGAAELCKPKPVVHAKPERRTVSWNAAIRVCLMERDMTFNELLATIGHLGTKKGLQKAITRMRQRYEISFHGKHKSSLYRLEK